MRVAVLDHRVQAAQVVPVGAGEVRVVQRVQHRLVVLVDQQDDPFAGAAVQRFDIGRQTLRSLVQSDLKIEPPGEPVHLRLEASARPVRLREQATAEADPQHRMWGVPVPAALGVQSGEELPVALEEFLHGVEQQALAEAPRTRQEVVRAALDQIQDLPRLVNVVAALLPHLAEGLDADGELLALHAGTLPPAGASTDASRGHD